MSFVQYSHAFDKNDPSPLMLTSHGNPSEVLFVALENPNMLFILTLMLPERLSA